MVLVISVNNRRYWWFKWDCISLIFGRVGDKKRRKTDSQTLCALCNAYFVHERIGTERSQTRIICIQFNIISQITIFFLCNMLYNQAFAWHSIYFCMIQHTYLHSTNIFLHRSDNRNPALQEQILLHSLVANNIIVIISL